MLFLARNGYRCVAHDRRGHGRSGQAADRNDMDGCADDLAAVIEGLALDDATLVGHSTGGGEVARDIGRHGTRRVAKVARISAVPPTMLKTDANPDALPIEVFDELRAGLGEAPRSSTRAWRRRRTAPTGKAPTSHKACWTSSGSGACNPAP